MNEEERMTAEETDTQSREEQTQEVSVSLQKEETKENPVSQQIYQEYHSKRSGTGTGDAQLNQQIPPNPYGQPSYYGQNQPYAGEQFYGQNETYGGGQNYGANQPYGNQFYGTNGSGDQNQQGSGLAVASLILGIISIPLFCCCINVITAVISIVLGIVHLSTRKQDKGVAIAGIACSAVSILLTIVYVVLVLRSPAATADPSLIPGFSLESQEQGNPFGDDEF
ncbi:MAG: hypothetical protein ACI4HI_14355 [Lachnospiraceae bacterium]